MGKARAIAGAKRKPTSVTIAKPLTTGKARRKVDGLRRSSELLEDIVDAGVCEDWTDDANEPHDAVPLDAEAEWREYDDDAMIFDQDPPARDPRPAWLPTPKLTIYLDNGSLAYQVHIPAAEVWGLSDSTMQSLRDWDFIGTRLVQSSPDCLKSQTLLEAVHALKPIADPVAGKFGQQVLERYDGQWSRIADKVIGTPFGRVPMYFFSLMSKANDPALWNDIETVGCALAAGARKRIRSGAVSVPEWFIEENRPQLQSEILAGSFVRQHGKALLAVVDRPEVVQHHRTRWPLTSPDALLEDLGLPRGSRQGRSIPVATLALAGAFDPAVNADLRRRCEEGVE